MTDRYVLPAMAALWSEEAKFARWLEVELLATEAWAELGVVPADDARRCRATASFTVEAIVEREQVTDHDVAAFVDVVQDSIGAPAGGWIHYGLTSTDVVDTAQCWALAQAADLLLAASVDLVGALKERAIELADVVCIGRTHGVHAEPTTYGAKFALWCLQAERDRVRLEAARRAIAVGKLSGAVGTYSNVDPFIESYVCERLGLEPVPATQVVARDRHAELMWACASVGATVELIATEVRHLQRTEVAEASEAFRVGQKGSSAMPHKRNPILSERLCGLARVLRGYLQAAIEDVALWHERDISHSSVERIILPGATSTAHYVLVQAARLARGLQVDATVARANIDRSFGLVFSQPVLLAMVRSGMPRDTAYRIVQEDARTAWDTKTPLRQVLDADTRVMLEGQALDEAFDLGRAVRHSGRFLDALANVGGA